MDKFLCIIFICFTLLGCKKPESKKVEKRLNKFQSIVMVETSEAQEVDLIHYIKSSGRTKAIRNIDVKSELSGKISEILIQENSYVNKNQSIVIFENRDLELQLRKISLKYQKTIDEYRAWLKVNPDSDTTAVALQVGLYEAQIELEEIELTISKTTVMAPFAGYVTNLDISIGENVVSGQKICDLYDNSSLQIEVDILENEMNHIEVGAKALIQFPSIDSKIYHGLVKSISPIIDTQTYSGKVILSLEQNAEIKAGMFAEVKILSLNEGEKLLVPKDALLTRDDRKLVFTVENSHAKWHYVKIGSSNDYFVEIVEGINKGNEIIVEGNFILGHDAMVKVTNHRKFDYYYNKF